MMKWFKRDTPTGNIFFIILITVVVLGIAAVLVYYVRRLKEPVLPAMHAIPSNAACVIELKNIMELQSSASKSCNVWMGLKSFGFFSNLDEKALFLDSIISEDRQAELIMESSSLYIAFVPVENGPVETLFLINMPTAHKEKTVNEFVEAVIDGLYQLEAEEYKSETIYSIHFPDLDKSFFYAVNKGVFIGSYSIACVKSSLDVIAGAPAFSSTLGYQILEPSAGENVDANVYLNPEGLASMIQSIADTSVYDELEFLKSFASMSELDMVWKPDEIVFSGYSCTTDSLKNFLSVFKGNEPGKCEAPSVLPYNSCFLLSFGFDDFAEFYDKYTEYRSWRNPGLNNDSVISALNNRFSMDIQKNLFGWISGCISVAWVQNLSDGPSYSRIIVCQAADSSMAARLLNEISTNNASENKKEMSSFNPRTGMLKATEIFPSLFGGPFKVSAANYLILGNNVIFADDVSVLNDIYGSWLCGKTLESNENFSSFSQNITEKSNVLLWVNTRKAASAIPLLFCGETAQSLADNMNVVRDFEGIALQFAWERENIFISNLYLKYNPAYKEENPSVWETELDTTVFGRPQVLALCPDSIRRIVAFDVAGSLYLLNSSGHALWEKKIGQKPIGDVMFLGGDKNSECSILFVAGKELWRVGSDGIVFDEWPVKLESQPTGPPALIRTEEDKDSRIFIPCADKRIYCYNTNGEKVDAWSSPNLKAEVHKKIEYFRMDGKDVLVATDKDGSIYFFDKKGKTCITPKKQLTRGRNSSFSLITGKKKMKLLFTKPNGSVVVMGYDGSVEVLPTGNYTAGHYFHYIDFDGNGSEDYLYTDSNSVYVHDQNRKLFYEYEISEDIGYYAPQSMLAENGKNYLALVAAVSSKLVLLQMKGLYSPYFHLFSNTPVCITSLGKGSGIIILTGYGKKVCYYHLR